MAILEIMGVVGVACLALAGVGLGLVFGRVQSRAWTLGYILPLIGIVAIALARHWPRFALVPPFAWIMAGRTEYALFGGLVTMVLTTPLTRTRQRALPVLVGLMLVVVVLQHSLLPFLEPILIREQLRRLPVSVNKDGVCRQTTCYTCGPAAAVTALRRIGLSGTEGELAILAHTSSSAGTPADLLIQALEKRYANTGLRCAYRCFDSISDLPAQGPVLVETHLSFWVDHWMVVLEVTDTSVALADPLQGRRVLSHEAFGALWRHTGITLARTQETAYVQ